MSILPVANPEPPKPEESAPGSKSDRPFRPKKKGKNYAQIHSKPLPLEIHPLPAFHPSNPISLLRLAYTWISHIFLSPTSHPPEPYVGYFSPETRSVHITDPDHVRALWEMGFFGKGNLSRSEPNWLEREKARSRREKFGAEDATNTRREERRMFKLERARVAADKVERQRLAEEGKLGDDGEKVVEVEEVHDGVPVTADVTKDESVSSEPDINGRLKEDPPNTIPEPSAPPNSSTEAQSLFPTQQTSIPNPSHCSQDPPTTPQSPDIQNEEHLHLTLEESFFLTYSLGILTILPPSSSGTLSPKSHPQPLSPRELLELFSQHATFPSSSEQEIVPDAKFLLNYVAYHHFRRLGWVVRPGMKFGCDWLLYNRGPAFSHAEFAVLVMPAYTGRFWNTPGGQARRRVSDAETRDWWGLHAVNRVQSQVKKSLVLAYVDVPSPLRLDEAFDLVEGGEVDVGRLLGWYRVREFVVRRWIPNRSRD